MIAPADGFGVALRGPMTQSVPVLRIGTRDSPLALFQARQVQARLVAAHGFDASAVEICPIRTTGDLVSDRPLTAIGGKGLFTKEIDQALIDAAIDVAVHSAKDMPAVLPEGLMIAGYLPREDARDAFIGRGAGRLADLDPGAVVGTASPRRHALVKRQRPDIVVTPLRGNVETRLAKLAGGGIAATVLALAGLKRLGLAGHVSSILDPEEFVPAIGQGAIAIVARRADERTLARIAAIADATTATALAAERAFLATLEGSCRTPIAGHAIVTAGDVQFHGMILRPDGSEVIATRRGGGHAEAAALGADAGRESKARAPADFFTPE